MLCVSSKAPYCCAGGRIQASIQTAASRSSSTAVSIMCWADALPLALLSSSGLQEQQKGEEGEECKKHELKFKSRPALEAWLHPALHPNPVGNPPPPKDRGCATSQPRYLPASVFFLSSADFSPLIARKAPFPSSNQSGADFL